jgi:DMSO/TMAO reductase YedYZ heme-binding membrane subunit
LGHHGVGLGALCCRCVSRLDPAATDTGARAAVDSRCGDRQGKERRESHRAPPVQWIGNDSCNDANVTGSGRLMLVLASGVPVAWLIARAAGLVAFALLTVSVTLGLMMSVRLLRPRRQKSLLGWHQTLLWTALWMLALHGGAILLDPVMNFRISAVLIPGLAPWRPMTIAAGVVAGYLMLTLATSFRARRRIGQRRWRQLHYASFIAFALALAHALHAGTDLKGNVGLVFAAVVLTPVLWLTFVRILTPGRPAPRVVPATPSFSPTRVARPPERAKVGVGTS